MATLNTLRTKGGIILSIFIGVALLAFLLGDMTRSQNRTVTVGKINGQKITYQEYMYEVDAQTNAMKFLRGSTSLSNEETENIQNEAWQQIVMKNLVMGDLPKMGIYVTDDEMVDMSSGNYLSPVLSSIFVNRSGQFDRQMMQEFIANLDQDGTGNARSFWLFVEGQMSQERAVSKYTNIIRNGVYVTDLEVNDGVRNTNRIVSADYVAQSVSVVPDSVVKVSDTQAREYYKKHTASFKQGASRDIRYVVFEAVPSADDYAKAREYFTNLNNDFKASSDPEQFANLNTDVASNPRYISRSQLPSYVAAESNLKSGEFFGPSFENNVFSAAQIVDARTMPDSLTIQVALIPVYGINLDSVMNAVNSSDAGFDNVVADMMYQYPNIVEAPQTAQVNTSDFGTNEFEKIIDLPRGRTTYISNGQYAQLIKVLSRGENVQKYKLAQLVYFVDPSSETEQQAYSSATEFADKVKNADEFNKVAGEEALLVRNAVLTPSMSNVSGIEGSREIVRWSFTNDKHSVSHVISIGNKNIVACVAEVKEQGIAPYESVKNSIVAMLTNEAKAAKVADEMKSLGTINAVASKYGTDTESASDVSFNSSYIPGLGMVPEIIGALSNMELDQVSVLPSPSMVVMARATSLTNTGSIDEERERVVLQSQNESNIEGRVIGAILNSAEVVDDRIIYF